MVTFDFGVGIAHVLEFKRRTPVLELCCALQVPGNLVICKFRRTDYAACLGRISEQKNRPQDHDTRQQIDHSESMFAFCLRIGFSYVAILGRKAKLSQIGDFPWKSTPATLVSEDWYNNTIHLEWLGMSHLLAGFRLMPVLDLEWVIFERKLGTCATQNKDVFARVSVFLEWLGGDMWRKGALFTTSSCLGAFFWPRWHLPLNRKCKITSYNQHKPMGRPKEHPWNNLVKRWSSSGTPQQLNMKLLTVKRKNIPNTRTTSTNMREKEHQEHWKVRSHHT